MAPRPPAVRAPRPLLGAAGLVTFLAQPVFSTWAPPLLVAGLVDEAAHVGTALIVLAVLPSPVAPAQRRAFAAAALAGSVLLDLDHLPGTLLGSQALTEGTARPYPHSLLTPLAALALAFALRRRARARALAAGVALGTALHLSRDLATGPGVALGWPLTDATAEVPYAIYAAALYALLALAFARGEERPRRASVRRRP